MLIEPHHLEKQRQLSPDATAAEAEAIARVADKITPTAQSAITAGLLAFRSRVDLRDVESLYREDRFDEIENLIPYSDFREDMFSLEAIAERGITGGAENATSFFKRSAVLVGSAVALRQFTFNRNAPSVQREILRTSGLAALSIEETSRRATRNAIIQAQISRLPPRQAAKLVQQSIGLTPRQATAVANFKANLEAGRVGPITRLGRGAVSSQLARRDMSAGKNKAKFLAAAGRKSVDKLGDNYADRLLEARANSIARTETFRAANAGQALLWEQAADEGLFDRQAALKRWHVVFDERLCPICAPLQGVEVPINALFDGAYERPPAHSSCRCHVSLVLAQ